MKTTRQQVLSLTALLALGGTAFGSVSHTFDRATGVLTITGDDANDIIEVRQNGANVYYHANGSGKLGLTPARQVRAIVVNAGGGNDVVTAPTVTKMLTIHGEAGNDVLSGSGVANTIIGGAGNDTINGLGGGDVLYGDNIGGESSLTVTELSGEQEARINALGAGQQGGVINGRATLWSGTPGSEVDLDPNGDNVNSIVNAISDGRQGGYVMVDDNLQASLWEGTAASWVSLHPAEATFSVVTAMNGGQQGGYALVDDILQASLWNGTADSWMSLHPEGAEYSIINALRDEQQAGEVDGHAALWSGTADSWVDLHPEGAEESTVYALSEGQQGGAVDEHAALWIGTAESWVDLNPEGASESSIKAMLGGQQVGEVDYGAALWTGTPDSWVDLHAQLPSDYTSSSATAIYRDGNTTYIGGYGYKGHLVALLWTLSSGGGGGDDTFLISSTRDACGDQIYGGSGRDTVKNVNPSGAVVLTDFRTTADLGRQTVFDVEVFDGNAASCPARSLICGRGLADGWECSDRWWLNEGEEGNGKDILDFTGITFVGGVTTVNLRAGNDKYIGGNTALTVHGGPGVDLLYAGAGGGVLNGDAGADTLYGGSAPTTMDGGAGSDTLYAGTTATVYAFDINQLAHAQDTVYGFLSGEDKLAVNTSIYRQGPLPVVYGPKSNGAVKQIRYLNDTDTVIFFPGGGANATRSIKLIGNIPLTTADFSQE